MGTKKQIKKLRAEVKKLAAGESKKTRLEASDGDRRLLDMSNRVKSREDKILKLGSEIAMLKEKNESLKAEIARLKVAAGRERRPDR